MNNSIHIERRGDRKKKRGGGGGGRHRDAITPSVQTTLKPWSISIITLKQYLMSDEYVAKGLELEKLVNGKEGL